MKKEHEDDMSLVDHLKELRNRVVICILGLVLGFFLVFHFAADILEFLTAMGTHYGYQFVYLSPQELFLQYMKIGVSGAICITSPILLYEIGRFIAPGLKKNESMVMFCSMTLGFAFFLIGVFFAYKVTVPFMLRFFFTVNVSTDITASISIENYLSMLITVFLIFGVVFELPVITVVLTQLGLLKPEWMISARPASIVVIFFVAAVITPPDIVSQCLVAGPMVLLYQLSIYLCKVFRKKLLKSKEKEIIE